MATSISIKTTYKPATGDLAILAYLDAETPCFSCENLPVSWAAPAAPHPDPGGTRVMFCGELGQQHVQARTMRADARFADGLNNIRKLTANALDMARSEKAKRLVFFLDNAAVTESVVEGFLLGGYVYGPFLSQSKPDPDLLLVMPRADASAFKKRLPACKTVCRYVNLARDWCNEPPDAGKPIALAKHMREAGAEAGVRVSVWDEKRLKKERCGGILAVGCGAEGGPRLVMGEYAPHGAKRHLCLVGKGITFDSGGYCLKPPASQDGMKYDMAGAAMMFAATCAIAQLKVPLNITVLTPLAENVLSHKAFLPNTVLTTRSGKTVEVVNTDAEGRLILADALTLAGEHKPDWIVDAATLTGACVVALGEDLSAVYGTDAELTRRLIACGHDQGERFWEMPLHLPYMEQLKATIADCKNVGEKYGGSITAALFLKQWAPENTPWCHCDIAGPAVKEKPLNHLGNGAKGFGVKTMVALAQTLGENATITVDDSQRR